MKQKRTNTHTHNIQKQNSLHTIKHKHTIKHAFATQTFAIFLDLGKKQNIKFLNCKSKSGRMILARVLLGKSVQAQPNTKFMKANDVG